MARMKIQNVVTLLTELENCVMGLGFYKHGAPAGATAEDCRPRVPSESIQRDGRSLAPPRSANQDGWPALDD